MCKSSPKLILVKNLLPLVPIWIPSSYGVMFDVYWETLSVVKTWLALAIFDYQLGDK
jgi:hypothetical protein